MKLSKNFWLSEFVPPEIYRNTRINPQWFVRPQMVKICQGIRDYYNCPITINDWFEGGVYQWSGYRTPNCPTGAALSQHKLCNAVDVKIDGINADEFQDFIKKNRDNENAAAPAWMRMITAIETDTATYTHISIQWTGQDNLLLIPRPAGAF
jgi:hypothetical protein